jgi:5'-3' exonuclease
MVPEMTALCGDGDNIKGVRGLGPVKARDALERWGSVAGILDAPAADMVEIEAQIKSAEKNRSRVQREQKKAPNEGAELALIMYEETLTKWRTRDACEKYRRAICADPDAVRLWLTLARLDPRAPLSPAFDLAACSAGRLDVKSLAAVYRRNGFTVLADDVESAA